MTAWVLIGIGVLLCVLVAIAGMGAFGLVWKWINKRG